MTAAVTCELCGVASEDVRRRCKDHVACRERVEAAGDEWPLVTDAGQIPPLRPAKGADTPAGAPPEPASGDWIQAVVPAAFEIVDREPAPAAEPSAAAASDTSPTPPDSPQPEQQGSPTWFT